jgi:DNA (cytosine-5)-methyltransferase 1
LSGRRPAIVDLFSGCGGFTLGAYEAGFRSKLAIDVDPKLTSSYRFNFPGSPLLLHDIARLSGAEVARRIGTERLDGVVGGPPCQGFSVIGKRDPGDPRNELVWHFFRLVRQLRPRFFVMENVPGIIAGPSATALAGAMSQVADRYTIVGPLEIDAVDFGAATRRSRIVVIGYDPTEVDGISPEEVRRTKISRPTTVREAISDLPGPSTLGTRWDDYDWRPYAAEPERGPTGDYSRRARMKPGEGLGSQLAIENLALGMVSGFQATAHSAAVIARYTKVEPGRRDPVSRFSRLQWDAPCITLRAGTGVERGSFQSVRPIHPDEHRVITVREAARLQGFPDWFLFHPSKWHSFRMIGNSVSPFMSSAIMRLIAARAIASTERSVAA